jgi:hypothetical protein
MAVEVSFAGASVTIADGITVAVGESPSMEVRLQAGSKNMAVIAIMNKRRYMLQTPVFMLG